jgi:hypothetical protein
LCDGPTTNSDLEQVAVDFDALESRRTVCGAINRRRSGAIKIGHAPRCRPLRLGNALTVVAKAVSLK